MIGRRAGLSRRRTLSFSMTSHKAQRGFLPQSAAIFLNAHRLSVFTFSSPGSSIWTPDDFPDARAAQRRPGCVATERRSTSFTRENPTSDLFEEVQSNKLIQLHPPHANVSEGRDFQIKAHKALSEHFSFIIFAQNRSSIARSHSLDFFFVHTLRRSLQLCRARQPRSSLTLTHTFAPSTP